MSGLQKQAVLDLIASLAAIRLFFTLLPLLGPWRAMASFALFCLAGLVCISCCTGRLGETVGDDHDCLIAREAWIFAKRVVLLGLLMLFLLVLLLQGGNASISLRALALVTWVSCCGFWLLRSTATLAFSVRRS